MRFALVASSFAGAAALAVMNIAAAQQPATVGDLLEKGGKKLNRDELSKLLSGAHVSGTSIANPNAKFELTYKTDGTHEGTAMAVHGVGNKTQFWGKWSVNEQGETCFETQFRGQPGTSTGCTSYYVLGGTYYQAAKDDKSAPVQLREIKR